MDIIKIFKNAAAELKKDERCVVLEQAKLDNDNDEALQFAIGEFNLARVSLNTELAKGDKSNEKVAELNAKVSKYYNEIMQNETMQKYNEAKQETDKLASHINAIVMAAINGEDPELVEAPEEGCSGSCSGCKGCS